MSSRKRKTILTPQSPLWAAFHANLTQRLQVKTKEGTLAACTHKATMPETYQALIAVGLAQRNVLATRAFFRDHGLHCDCLVWLHPGALLEEPREAWEDADGNFDADAYYWSEIRPYE